MRLRNNPEAKKNLKKSKLVLNNNSKWQKHFKNNNPINLEIGMGKGKFIFEIAKQNPNQNYIGIEKYATVQWWAISKQQKETPKLHKTFKNLRLMTIDADQLANLFDKQVDKIYINFPDPWPKSRHEKRRLLSEQFLKVYSSILKDGAEIIFKTDQLPLFEWAETVISEKKAFTIISKTNDLNSENIENIKTEYEDRFNSFGIKINRMVIKYNYE